MVNVPVSISNNQPVITTVSGPLHSISLRIFNANSLFRNNSLKNPFLFSCNDILFITDARVSKSKSHYFNKFAGRIFFSFSREIKPLHGTALFFPDGYIFSKLNHIQNKIENPCFNIVSIINFLGHFEIFASLYLPKSINYIDVDIRRVSYFN